MTIDQASEDAINEAAQRVDPNASLYVERGFHDSSTSVALLVLGVLGAVLVLGGTLTATFLALSDARPDFATMGAVGAGPRTRRLVASSYALAIGLVGAVLGARRRRGAGHRGDLPADEPPLAGRRPPTRTARRSPTTSSTCRGCWSARWSSACRCSRPPSWPWPPARGCRWSAGCRDRRTPGAARRAPADAAAAGRTAPGPVADSPAPDAPLRPVRRRPQSTRSPLAQASISSTARIPTDS